MSIVVSENSKSSSFSIDAYGSVRTAEKTCTIDLKSMFGTCHFRDCYTCAGTGNVFNRNARYELTIGGTDDRADLTSWERGSYVAGLMCECGLGVQVDPTSFTAGQTLDFGYYDDNDGYFFRLSQAGVTLCVRKDGSTTYIASDAWNGDFGKYVELNIDRGLVWTVSFTFYGYGSIIFGVAYSDPTGGQVNRTLHSHSTPSGTSCSNPNLPIKVDLRANGSTDPITAYVGGRQFSIVGNVTELAFRTTSFTETLTFSSDWALLASYKKRSTHVPCAMRLAQIDVVTDTALLLAVRIDATLTGATFAASIEDAGTIAGVSGLSRDTAATACTGGLGIYKKLVPAGFSSIEVPASVRLDARPCSILLCTPPGISSAAAATLMLHFYEYY